MNKSEDDEDLPEATDASIREMNSPELGYNIVGVILALAVGGVQPLFAIMFSEIYGSTQSIFSSLTATFPSSLYWNFNFIPRDLSKTQAHLVNMHALMTLLSKKRLMN